MKTCKCCGKEIFNEEKFCETCGNMTKQERRKNRPERYAFLLYIADFLLIAITALIAVWGVLPKLLG